MTFTHVLNFLRSSQLPPPDVAESVYKEALVWGLEELSSALECVPPVMIKVCKENTRNVIPGYIKFFSFLLEWISDGCKENICGRTTVYIALQEGESEEAPSGHVDQNHICFGTHELTKAKVNADLYFGPWGSVVQATGKDMLGFIVADLLEKDFDVSDFGILCEQCHYKRRTGDTVDFCHRQLFHLTVRWWPTTSYGSRKLRRVTFETGSLT